MIKISWLAITFLILTAFGLQAASAQFRIPDIPRIKKPKAEPPPKGGGESAPAAVPAAAAPTAGVSAASQDQPTVAKDSIQVKAYTNSSYRKSFSVWSWVPSVTFRVNGPIASGSQLYVEYTIPGGAPVKFDCPTQETQKDYWSQTECGGQSIPEDKRSIYTGPVSFALKMRNELAGTDSTLFTGKMKVAKARSNTHGPQTANHFVYYVDHDWNLPIGYIFYEPSQVSGWDLAGFNVAFWVRGDKGRLEPHLFYQGKEVGMVYFQGERVGKPACGETEVENNPTRSVEDSLQQKAKWTRVKCHFPAVKSWDKTPGGRANAKEMFLIASNPGEYELKVLWNNRLARSIKFTVGADGSFNNGIASANKLNTFRVVVPVQIIGDQDGQWDRAAWKTEAFYGHPLQGFTAP
ncbi:MAG: hypothetical protein LC776_01810 [Acidobacteria bacterium]|nr:hypothetical protein [Acidobacteriota bacterium]